MDKALSYYLNPAQTERHAHHRVFEIDFLRGFDIFLMVLLHGCCAFADVGPGRLIAPISGQDLPGVIAARDFAYFGVFSTIDYGNLWVLEFFFSSLFMFLCGISCSFSHNNYERGIKLSFVALALTLILEFGDFAFHLNIHIYLGILHALAIGILFYALIDHYFPSFWVDYAIGIGLAIANIVTVYFAYSGTGGLYSPISMPEANLPREWYKLLLGTARFGDDYFSPINTSTFIFLGATVGKTYYKDKESHLPPYFPTKWATPILWCGSNSLLLYVLHMPFFYLLLALILFPFGYRLAL